MASEAVNMGFGLMFFPYMNGASSPHWYESSTGCFYGIGFDTHSRDFPAAVMEGVAFQLHGLLTSMDAYTGTSGVIFFGGGANIGIWRSIIADVINMPVKIPVTEEAAGAGAAICAGVAAGMYDIHSLPQIGFAETVFPDARMAGLYQKKYKEYRSIEKKLWEEKR
jgi:xylulokinase